VLEIANGNVAVFISDMVVCWNEFKKIIIKIKKEELSPCCVRACVCVCVCPVNRLLLLPFGNIL
jgi:hypothetical protein